MPSHRRNPSSAAKQQTSRGPYQRPLQRAGTMAVKHFNADLQSTRTRLQNGVRIPGVVKVERGDSDGEAVATFVHEAIPIPIRVRLLSTSVDQYPDDNSFLVFTDTEDAPATLLPVLADLQNFTFGQNVFDLLLALSSHIHRSLSSIHKDGGSKKTVEEVNPEENDAASDEEENDASDLEDSDLYGDADDGFGSDSVYNTPEKLLPVKLTPVVFFKVQHDLRKAREAGVKIGFLQGIQGSAKDHIFSLSLRARTLGVSDEALEAWDVDPSEYIVLVIRMNESYPSATNVYSSTPSAFRVSYRFGKCIKYKPSLRSVQSAFNMNSDDMPRNVETDDDFKKVFMSASLEKFMEENFLALFKLRLQGVPSWDDANDRLRKMELQATGLPEYNDNGPVSDKSKSKSNSNSKSKAKGKATAASVHDDNHMHTNKTLPAILLSDLFSNDIDSISTPLVAMQFATHYFVRCTEYCLRCHQRIPKEFEALKPFVCSNPLCLFQYITMGFGPSVEHEILTQPYVVDLLVSLCYSSVHNPQWRHQLPVAGSSQQQPPRPTYAIREFPLGLLRIKVPAMRGNTIKIHGSPLNDPIPVTLDLDNDLLTVANGSDTRLPSLVNDNVVLQYQYKPNGGSALISMTVPAYIKAFKLDRQGGSLEIYMAKKGDLLGVLGDSRPSTVNMTLFHYESEFDDLDESEKAQTIMHLLDGLPPISHLREYLLRNPHRSLKSHGDISPATLTLLKWIVASNRSFIVQVSQVQDKFATDPELHASIKTREQEIVPGMHKDYIQFRFAQGNPDKELRFHRSLREVEAAGQTKYPTIFAWHGSNLQNWHSILRQGLDFKDVQHGRAFGTGVYFSPDFRVSFTYMQPGASWPSSALESTGVIALCEIINSPHKFQSQSPHYVVQQLDWIQCRYLFVSKKATLKLPPAPPAPLVTVFGIVPANAVSLATALPVTQLSDRAVNKDMVEIHQDPKRLVLGPDGQKLSIPLKAIPGSRTAQQAEQLGKKAQKKTAKRSLSLKQTDESDEEDAADIQVLFSDAEHVASPKRAKGSSTRKSSVDSNEARQINTKRPETPPMTDFRPGTLQTMTLPRLGLPQWVTPSTTKRLTQDIKVLQKVQATTPLHLLGWYVDFEKIDNMFQWIVELHSFDPELPLAKDMKKAGITSIVLEVRFGRDYPFAPPFVRVIRPQFLPFANGGGGHVTLGGAICMEMLTSNGWTPATSMEAVFVCIKMAMSSVDPKPARLLSTKHKSSDYNAGDALAAFQRAAMTHGWKIPTDTTDNATQTYL